MKPIDGGPVRRKRGSLRKWLWLIPLACWLLSLYLPAAVFEFPADTYTYHNGKLHTISEEARGWMLLIGGPWSLSWAPADPFLHWERAIHSLLVLLCWCCNLLFVAALLALQHHRKVACWLSGVATGLVVLAPTSLAAPPEGGLGLITLHAGYYVWSAAMLFLWAACVAFPKTVISRSMIPTA